MCVYRKPFWKTWIQREVTNSVNLFNLKLSQKCLPLDLNLVLTIAFLCWVGYCRYRWSKLCHFVSKCWTFLTNLILNFAIIRCIWVNATINVSSMCTHSNDTWSLSTGTAMNHGNCFNIRQLDMTSTHTYWQWKGPRTNWGHLICPQKSRLKSLLNKEKIRNLECLTNTKKTKTTTMLKQI